jgi:hypothetical protein
MGTRQIRIGPIEIRVNRSQPETHGPSRSRIAGTAVLVVAAVTLLSASGGGAVPAPSPFADGPAANANVLHLGAEWSPWSPGPGELGANPMAFAIDHVVNGRTVKKVISSWARNEDSPTAPLNTTRAVAENNGQVWLPYDALPVTHTMVGTIRLRDGSVLSASFVPVSAPAPNRVGFPMARSTDLAKSWTTWTAPLVENLWKLSWYRVHRDLIELDDGTIIMGGYGQGTINGRVGEYTLVFESSDGGKTFRQRSAINTVDNTNELGMARTSDGRLIAVMRGAETVPRPPAMPLKVSFSDDDGRTWEPLKPYLPPAGMPNNGVMPKLVLQPNGQLLMTYGRPDNNVVISRDGTGKVWEDGGVVYSRYPREGSLGRWMGSSGNMDLVPLNNGTSLAFGDTCHNIWFCREYGHDNKIWVRQVDAVTPGAGKLDLATRVRDGSVKLSGTVVAKDERFAEQRIEGVVDGSSEYRSAARFAGEGKLTVELDKVYTLDRIGLMLDKGKANSANVQVSVDGKAWGQPVVKTGASTDDAMRYHDIEPVRAKYVRFVPGDDAPLTAITELELYAANLLTFENDPVHSTPRTLTDTRYAYVANTIMSGLNSERRMVLVDADMAAKATATFPATTPSPGQHISFGYTGEGYGAGAVWDILGRNSDGVQVSAYRLHFAPDWARNRMLLRVWDGGKWVEVGGVSPVIPNYKWISIAIDTTVDRATITVNGQEMSTTTRLAEVTSFTGFKAETGLVPADVGNMEHSYDDVVIAPLQ